MSASEIICQTLDIAGNMVKLVAKNAAKLICYYRLKEWSKAFFLGTPKNAITVTTSQLGAPGASIDPQKALDQITAQVEDIIPQLADLKAATNVALTEITEIHPIDRVSLSIGIPISTHQSLGPVNIDGIGFRIQATKTS